MNSLAAGGSKESSARAVSGVYGTHLFASRPPRHERGSLTSLAVSILLHAIVIALLVWLSGAGITAIERSGDSIQFFPGGGGGGGSGGVENITYMSVVEAPAAAAAEVTTETVATPPPIETPVLPAPEAPHVTAMPETAKPVAIPVAAIVRIAANGSGTGSGTGAGSGTGSGTGTGTGSGNGSGNGSGDGSGTGPGTGGPRLLPPSPRALILPPQAPSGVHGTSVTVRLLVDSAGVVRDVDLVPGTGDGGFDKKLKETARDWLFRPARDAAGRAVAATFDVVFSF